MRKNDAFVAKIVNTRLTKILMAIFAPDERLPSSATLNSARSDGSLKLFLAHYILHQSTNGGVIDNTETDQQALAPEKTLLLCIERGKRRPWRYLPH